MRIGTLTGAAALCLAVTGFSATSAHAFKFEYLPSEKTCLERVEEVDTQLRCLKQIALSAEVQTCLSGGNNLAVGKSVGCWDGGEGPLRGGSPAGIKFSDSDMRTFANCLQSRSSLMLKGGTFTCVKTPDEVARFVAGARK